MQAATNRIPESWTPDSWRSKPATQQPAYPDAERLQEVLGQLGCLPPLVTSWEVERLKEQLAEAARGERFLLQGGDCAETLRRLHLGVDRQQAEDPAPDEPGAGARRSAAG